MNGNKRRNHGLTICLVILALALAGAIIWGVYAAAKTFTAL